MKQDESNKEADTKKGRRKSQSRRRSSLSTESFVNYILQKERSPSPSGSATTTPLSPATSAKLSRLTAQFPDSSDEESGTPRQSSLTRVSILPPEFTDSSDDGSGPASQDSQIGSVQKFLQKGKPEAAGKISKQKVKPRRVQVVRRLADDLRRRSLMS